MKKRIVWKMLALTILTLGIYRLFWFVNTRREMMNRNPNIKIISPLLLFIPVIVVVAAFGIFIFSTVQTISNQPLYCRNARTSYGSTDTYVPTQRLPKECQSSTPIWGIGLMYASILLFYPLLAVWLWSYSKGVEIMTGGHTSFAIALIILLLVPDGVDILIIQDSFNKLPDVPLAANGSGAPTPVAA